MEALCGIPARMGFDPRRWRPPAGSRPITANVESLLAENEALRREVRALRLQLELLQAGHRQQSREPGWRSSRSDEHNPRGHNPRGQNPSGHNPGGQHPGDQNPAGHGSHSRVSQGRGPLITPQLIERWGAAMARHPAWSSLRIGPPGGLRALIEELRRKWWNPALSLEEELDRHSPGLGGELSTALRGPHSRVRWAVRAAFALYGPRAIEWLNEEPRRVVDALLQRLERLGEGNGSGPDPQPAASGAGPQGPWRRRGTRTANHSQAWNEGASGAAGSGPDASADRSAGASGSERGGSGARSPGSGGSGSGSTGARGSQAGRSQAGKSQAGGANGYGNRWRGGAQQRSTADADPRREALRLLGLESGANAQSIKRAFRRLAKTHHPDLGGDAEAFRRIDAAYRLLLH